MAVFRDATAAWFTPFFWWAHMYDAHIDFINQLSLGAVLVGRPRLRLVK